MERRTELLRAAARVYAKYGYRGSTTRRIADEAGVNEVTIFRQFGSKDALIHEAIATCGGSEELPDLPVVPSDPQAELTAWSDAVMRQLREMRELIRRCISERDEHPHLHNSSNSTAPRASAQLRGYLQRMRDAGIGDPDFDVKGAAAMLMGSLFADAMGRDAMPDVFPSTPMGVTAVYTRLVLRAIGADNGVAVSVGS
jgi:AcrR family transcriptional regulator